MLDFQQRFIQYKEQNPHELTSRQFKKLEYDIRHIETELTNDEMLDFLLWCKNLPSRQENFANYIGRKLSNHPGATILEVGGGRTGRLSRFLSEKGFCMTCIDPKLEISSTDKIEFIKDAFDYMTFDLSKFDYVIAQEPCDATEHIVRACINQGKPFMISLCGNPHKLLSGKMPKTVYDWYDHLLSISCGAVNLRYLKFDPFSKTALLRSTIF